MMRSMTSRTLLALGLAVAVAAALWLACTSSHEGELREGVQAESLRALSRLESYEVQASGELRQGDTRAEFKLSYEFVAPDRLRFLSESTAEEVTERAGLIIIGEQSWALEGDGWVEQPLRALDIGIFSAERVWGLVPFGGARLQEQVETVNGVQARHYRFDRSAQLSFQSLAGALLAGADPQFRGDLSHFTIDYWTDASDEWPVRMELTAEGGDRGAEMTVNLTKANDSSIGVDPPPTLTPAAATPTASPEASPIAEVTPVAEFEVTVISAVVPANVREAPTTEADLAGVIPIGIKAKVVGKVIGQEAFPGTGNRIWYLVKAIPPDLPKDGFVHSGVVKR